jgi:hypothetical protein
MVIAGRDFLPYMASSATRNVASLVVSTLLVATESFEI